MIFNFSFPFPIEIPGQYEMTQNQVLRQNTVKIAGFKDEVKVFPSLRRPIKMTMIGDDGKDYNFLVKNGEDLRQDQRIGTINSRVTATPKLESNMPSGVNVANLGP